MSSFVRPCVIGFLTISLSACSAMPRVPFTREEQAVAQVPGIPSARFFADEPPPEAALAILRQRTGNPPTVLALSGGGSDGAFGATVLALSGGGSDGAFGAGLLIGWSQSGTRPEFTIVSGVSAGALIAPFAFLGPEYDPVLQEVLTGGYAAQLSHIKGLASILAGGLPNAQLLRRLVAQFIDDRMIERVAEEHRRGRRLIVVTTNLDAQRSVVWNLGAIAASARADRFEIFREVLVASASIPGVFSPVLIDVEANGRYFNEMHVDGGVTRNVLAAPDSVIASGNFLPSGVSGRIYVIINNKIAPDFDIVKNRTLPVIRRSASTMVKANTNAVLLATDQFARIHGLQFHLAAIDPAYPTSPTNDFTRDYLVGLFQHGIERVRSGRVWQSRISPSVPPATKSRLRGTASNESDPVASTASLR